MPYEHRLKRRVQFYETDMAGIVHFSCYFRYMEEAEHAMWREAGLSVADAGGLAWPRIEASCEYHRPLRFEDEFEVHLRIIGKDAQSIRYESIFTKDGTRVATGRIAVRCAVRNPGEPMRSANIPPDIDAILQVAPGG